jgi:hypothetical protein
MPPTTTNRMRWNGKAFTRKRSGPTKFDIEP